MVKMHTTYDNVVHPFNKNHILETIALEKERGKRCVECKSKKVKYRQFSPDLGGLLFCSLECHAEFNRTNLYRALPIEEIKL